MLFTSSIEIARLLEAADTAHITRQAETCVQRFPDHKIQAQSPAGGGVAVITLPSFGGKLNHVVGLGMSGTVSPSDLHAIENLYSIAGLGTRIDLCPLAHPSAVESLSKGGYGISGFINTYAKVLTDEDLEVGDMRGVKVVQLTKEREEEFVGISLEGYRDNGRPEHLLSTLAQIAVLRSDTSLYIALIGGKIAGSAGLALIETEKGK